MLAVVASACGESSASSNEREVVDLQRGSFRGVTLGESRRAVRRILGPPLGEPDEGFEPVGVDRDSAGFPYTISPPRRGGRGSGLSIRSMQYRGVGFLVERRAGVYTVGITAKGAVSRRGVGIGSSREDVMRRYPRLNCGTQNNRPEGIPRPYCAGRIRRGIHVWFGQDPVQSIIITTQPLL